MTKRNTYKRRETYTDERVLERFYADLIKAANSSNPDSVLARIHLPHSDVHYVREAMHNDTGIKYTLQYVEWAMLKENMLSVDDCFEGSIRVKWDEYQGEKLCKTRN